MAEQTENTHMDDHEEAFSKELGQRIAALRKERGLTQVQLADALHTKQYVIANYETGRCRVPIVVLPKLCEALGVPVETILGIIREESKKRGPTAHLQQQIEQISQLPRSRQKFISEFLDTVLEKAHA